MRVQRIDLPDEVSGSVYQRMQESFRARGNQLRAEGSADAERIRAEADRKRTEMLANAQRDAQRLRGEGDALAGRIYAQAYGKSPEFYSVLPQPAGLSHLAGPRGRRLGGIARRGVLQVPAIRRASQR